MYGVGNSYGKITEYTPPFWSTCLEKKPTHKINLAMTMTPVHRWQPRIMPQELDLYIKRDDMTGSCLGGNKIRKLEFVFAEAVKRGCGSYIKCGNAQSNECRAIALIAAQLDMDAYLLLRKNPRSPISLSPPRGNFKIMEMCAAKMILFPENYDYETEIFPKTTIVADAIHAKTGKTCFIDGRMFHSTAIHGYLRVWDELLQQGIVEEIDDIVVATSSGITLAGLAVGNQLTDSKVKIHGVAMRKDDKFFYDIIDDILRDVGLTHVKSRDVVDIIDGYQCCTDSLEDTLRLCNEIASSTGVLCDPTYGGRAVKALRDEFIHNRHRFKGKRILYIHTGGIFSVFDHNLPPAKKDMKTCNWEDAEQNLRNFV